MIHGWVIPLLSSYNNLYPVGTTTSCLHVGHTCDIYFDRFYLQMLTVNIVTPVTLSCFQIPLGSLDTNILQHFCLSSDDSVLHQMANGFLPPKHLCSCQTLMLS